MFETLGHYKVLDRIGAGGLGEVYRARDTRLGRTVAIKVLPPEVAGDPDRRARFLREARAAAALSHPNIAALYEIGEDQDQLFLVFEYVPGETLRTTIAGRPLNPRRAIDLAVQIADALADAHAAGIVHRDIKPDNIIVTPKGNAKVLDFGLAAWTAGGAQREQAATTVVTAAGTTLGTAAYMSPEQALGERTDHRTDIFSLGIVLFEMLTGKPPFVGATTTALALQIVQAPAPVPSAVNRSLPPELDPIVARALAKSLDQRYESAATLAAELRSVGAILDVRSDIQEAAEAVAPTRSARPARRSALGLVVLLLVIGALAALAWFERIPAQRMWRRTMGPPPPPVIAVVPFETDADQLFFADGLAEDLITRLGQTPGLKVMGRSATRQLRGRAPQDVARQLGAAVVLTGSVRPAAEMVRMSLELIDPSDGTAIWSQQYTREVKDIFAVQAQVAEQVATALRVTLQPTQASARAASRLVDPRAYELYLRGRAAVADRRPQAAIALFDQAIAADAGLVEAFAGLAEALRFEAQQAGEPDDPIRLQRLKGAAERAYQQDPDLPAANLAMGLASDSLAQALRYMRHAVEVDPSFSVGFHEIGDAISDFDPERAIEFYRRSLALDPRLDANKADMAIAFVLLNRPEEARKSGEGLRRAPWTIAMSERRYGDAVAYLEQNPQFRQSEESWLQYIVALASAGRRADGFREATAFVARHPGRCAGSALLAGLSTDRPGVPTARQLAAPIFEAARAADARGSLLACAAGAAAAVGDTAQFAGLLDRIAASDTLMRSWAVTGIALSGQLALRGSGYPWSAIVEQPGAAAATRRMAAAYARERETARAELKGLP